MAYQNIIDMSGYFLKLQHQNMPTAKRAKGAIRFFSLMKAFVETSAAIIMAVCICVCTTVVLSMS